ncbi:hypothetical protein B0H10DRAFT_1951071 [Mycena sp. CBHHK59/15]|nr:hypothetical protein B0H10DRAFT_1951071 [Mycena sp. CBHHK59/15]
MPPPLGKIWGPFHRSEDRPNGAHNRATHWRNTDDDVAQNRESVLVSSRAAWRKQVAVWQSEMWDAMSDSDNDDAPQAAPSTGARRRTNWLPIQLDKLFGGNLKEPICIRPSRAAVSEEALYMQLLAAEHSGEEPDDGELEGSGVITLAGYYRRERLIIFLEK